MTDERVRDHGTVHLYGQDCFHAPAYIVADREGLEAIRDAITAALERGAAKADLFASDGEGYDLWVMREDAAFGTPEWYRWAMPYKGTDFAEEHRADALWPWDLTSINGVAVNF